MSKIKEVRFDFYKAVLGLDRGFEAALKRNSRMLERIYEQPEEEWSEEKSGLAQKCREMIESLKKEQEYSQTKWLLGDAIRAAVSGEIDHVMAYSDVEIELDKDTYVHDEKDEPWLYAFQLTKLRSTELPSKKKIGKERENIALKDDEYIGEFTQIIYDERYNTVAIQSNRYGVSYGLVNKYLNCIRNKYLERIGAEKYLYLIGMLEPLVDDGLTQKALKSKAFKKLKLKCSDVNVNGIVSPDNATVGSIAGLIGQQSGVVVEVTISVKGRKESKTLSSEDIEETAQKFLGYMRDSSIPPVQKKDASMELTYYDSTFNSTEAVNLLIPKVNFFVKIEAEDRKPIDATYLFGKTKEVYDKYTGILKALVGEENEEDN